jgi:YebC/PmpR family DNA-binding regulatory protein
VLFTKLSRAITVAARHGSDPNFNFALRLAIDAARAANVPKENIEKAMKRGTGELKDEAQIEEIIYEAVGPGGAGLIIQTATDNKNRTVAGLKQILSRHNATLGGRGAISWQFAQKGVTRVPSLSEESELILMDKGVEDILRQSEYVEIICSSKQLPLIVETIKKFNIEILSSGLEWISKEQRNLSEIDKAHLEDLVAALAELDDVQAVYY